MDDGRRLARDRPPGTNWTPRGTRGARQPGPTAPEVGSAARSSLLRGVRANRLAAELAEASIEGLDARRVLVEVLVAHDLSPARVDEHRHAVAVQLLPVRAGRVVVEAAHHAQRPRRAGDVELAELAAQAGRGEVLQEALDRRLAHVLSARRTSR
jgi:hypothetical protein